MCTASRAYRCWRIGLRGMRGFGTRAPAPTAARRHPRRDGNRIPAATRSILQFAPQAGAVASMPLLTSNNAVTVGARRSCSIACSGTRFGWAGPLVRGPTTPLSEAGVARSGGTGHRDAVRLSMTPDPLARSPADIPGLALVSRPPAQLPTRPRALRIPPRVSSHYSGGTSRCRTAACSRRRRTSA